MDPNFTFPSRAPVWPTAAPSPTDHVPSPTPRPAPAHSSTEPVNRNSNVLRSSVFDAALQLGLVNSKMAAWMFDNALEEDAEEEEPEEESTQKLQLSPTSDEYAPDSTPPTSIESHSQPPSQFTSSPTAYPQVHFPPSAQPPAAPTTNKLRKPRKDGYESDGGYVSDGGKKGRARTKSKPSKPDPAAVFPISEPVELIPTSKEDRKRKKKAAKGAKDAGADTDTEDVGKPTKSKGSPKSKGKKKGSVDAGGYETDDGYVSLSGKSKPPKTRGRFFSLRKKSEPVWEPVRIEPEPVPPMPMPEREVFDLPIASRFATTLGPSSTAPNSVAPSRSETPLLPPTRPFALASGSSSPSSSSATSLLTPVEDSLGAGSLWINPSSQPYTGAPDGWNGNAGDKKPSNISPASNQEQFSSRVVSPLPPNPKSKQLISYPLTRTTSLAGSSGQNTSTAKPKFTPSPILLSPSPPTPGLNSRAASPGPSPIGSPFVLLTPINTSGGPGHSPAVSEGSSDIVPSADYIVPSRSASPLPPSPHVLGYYDIAPPGLPPTGPLPRAPPSSMRDPAPGPGIARLRSISRDRAGVRDALSPTSDPPIRAVSPVAMSATPWSGATSPVSAGGVGATSPVSPNGVQRGRAAPFPSQPILQARAAATSNGGLGPGLAARAKVDRYRDLYAIEIPDTPQRDRRRADDETSVNINVDEGSDVDDQEMAGVLGRFRDGGSDRLPRTTGSALERNNSGALRSGSQTRKVRFSPSNETSGFFDDDDDDDESRYLGDDRASRMYQLDNDSSGGEEGGFRDTMFSQYSRASFLNPMNSEQARVRLVDRVGAIYDSNGREQSAIPPVPKLPPELLAGATRF